VLATTITAIGLTLVLTFPAPILQTMPPGVADNPVRGADATVAWIVASGRDRSPTFEALVRRVAELNAAVIVCWSGRQGTGARGALMEQIERASGGVRSMFVVLDDLGTTEAAIEMLGRELRRAIDTLEGLTADPSSAQWTAQAIREELKPKT
jgi:hypothetical protein